MLGAGALGQSSAVSRGDSRDSLLHEDSQLSVDGTFTTSVNEDNVIIEAPLSQSVQDARNTLQATIDSASSTLSSSDGKASSTSRSTLSGLIDQANATVGDDNANTDSIYAVNASLAEAANKVTSEVAAANAAAAERTTRSSSSSSTASSASSSSASTVTVSGSGNGQAVANLAIQYLGTPYVSGGNTPNGWDCSGYVQWVYAQFGITLDHYSGSQAQAGTYIGGKADLYAKAQPGDIIANNSHAAIYVGGGNCAQAMNPSLGTRIYPCDVVSTFASGYSIRRIFN